MEYKNFNELIDSFIKGVNDGKIGNLKIKGNQLFHYNTAICERKDNYFILNVTRYSIQTGQVQKKLLNKLSNSNVKTVKKVPVDYQLELEAFLK